VGGDYVPSFIHLQHPCNSKRSTSRCDMSVAVADENPNPLVWFIHKSSLSGLGLNKFHCIYHRSDRS
jgi:hypothetical protein